jgi:hypothetical protein
METVAAKIRAFSTSSPGPLILPAPGGEGETAAVRFKGSMREVRFGGFSSR